VASFLGGHGEKQRMLPALIVVQTSHAGELAVNAGRKVIRVFRFGLHTKTMPADTSAGKSFIS
jgi:hypothetical protein